MSRIAQKAAYSFGQGKDSAAVAKIANTATSAFLATLKSTLSSDDDSDAEDDADADTEDDDDANAADDDRNDEWKEKEETKGSSMPPAVSSPVPPLKKVNAQDDFISPGTRPQNIPQKQSPTL